MERSNLYIVLVVGMGLSCAVVVCIAAPTHIAVQLPVLFALITGVVAILQKSKETEKKVDLASITLQDKTAEAHGIVNSQRSEMMAEIRKLQADLANVRQSQAVERSTGAAAVREAVASEREAVRDATASERETVRRANLPPGEKP